MLGAIRFTVSANTSASPEDVIEVLSDWRKLPQYWHGMREISRTSGEMLKVRFAFPGEGRMSYICDMGSLCCTENYHDGPFSGFKRIEISGNEGGSVITVKWEVQLSTKLVLFKRFISRHFQQGTDSALKRIVLDAENVIRVSSGLRANR